MLNLYFDFLSKYNVAPEITEQYLKSFTINQKINRDAKQSRQMMLTATPMMVVDGTYVIKNKGSIPIPPYLNRDPLPMDDERYQTVYAEESKMSSTAAPTAGLHFDSTLMERIKEKGIEIAPITLDIGLGTFKPIKDSDFSKHQMHSERINLSKESSELIKSKLNSKGRIISVGTTSLRCLESIFQKFGEIRPFEGETDIFIYPGFKFNVIDALITNFHLPKSTLMLLVSAFAGESTINKAYEHAISNEYRFFSYGDAMFLNRS